MKTKYLISFRILAFVSLAAFPAGAQWVRWEASTGGNGHWYQAVQNTNGNNWTQVNELARAEGGFANGAQILRYSAPAFGLNRVEP